MKCLYLGEEIKLKHTTRFHPSKTICFTYFHLHGQTCHFVFYLILSIQIVKISQGQVLVLHRRNVCKISSNCRAISSFPLNVSSLNSVEGYSLTALYQKSLVQVTVRENEPALTPFHLLRGGSKRPRGGGGGVLKGSLRRAVPQRPWNPDPVPRLR